MPALYELLSILLTSFVLNAIPFAGPSNLLIASNAALLTEVDPLTIGFLVALGSVSAKLIHYVVSFFIGSHVGEKRRERIDAAGLRFKRWAFLALFVVAASPLPDEPVVIPLGLMKYSPAKFCLAYFVGKLSITIVGAQLGLLSQGLFASVVSQEIFVIASIVLTIAVTVILLKVDVLRIAEKVLKRKKESPHQ